MSGQARSAVSPGPLPPGPTGLPAVEAIVTAARPAAPRSYAPGQWRWDGERWQPVYGVGWWELVDREWAPGAGPAEVT